MRSDLADLEVADIFRRHGHAYAQAHDGPLGRIEWRVMSAIELCRTAAIGSHVKACEDCAHVRVAYNSCRNRHCSKCQSATRERWLADRRGDLLPVSYFHVVFTVPSEVAEIAFLNKAVVYAILFDAVAATLKTIAADPRHLGGEIGFLAILHTWGQALTHHPHIHCLVPGGALSSDGRWLGCRPNFFLPVHVLSRLFRRLFLERLQAAHAAGRLRFSGKLDGYDDADVFTAAIGKLRRKNWIVYAKPPFGSPEHVLAYLGRYTHRVAISNSRLVQATKPTHQEAIPTNTHVSPASAGSFIPHRFRRCGKRSNRNRRRAKDFEQTITSAIAWLFIASNNSSHGASQDMKSC